MRVNLCPRSPPPLRGRTRASLLSAPIDETPGTAWRRSVKTSESSRCVPPRRRPSLSGPSSPIEYRAPQLAAMPVSSMSSSGCVFSTGVLNRGAWVSRRQRSSVSSRSVGPKLRPSGSASAPRGYWASITGRPRLRSNACWAHKRSPDTTRWRHRAPLGVVALQRAALGSLSSRTVLASRRYRRSTALGSFGSAIGRKGCDRSLSAWARSPESRRRPRRSRRACSLQTAKLSERSVSRSLWPPATSQLDTTATSRATREQKAQRPRRGMDRL